MNRWIPLLLILVLLTGCASQNPQPSEATAPVSHSNPGASGFYDAETQRGLVRLVQS